MELSKSEKSQNSDTPGIKLINTSDSDNESNFCLGWDMDGAS